MVPADPEEQRMDRSEEAHAENIEEEAKTAGGRLLLPDVLRGFAIVMVVLGHSIQVGSGQEFRDAQQYFEDGLYQFIYSFHMPLFMLLAGMFSYRSIADAVAAEPGPGHTGAAAIRKRVRRLLLPVLVWTILDTVRWSLQILFTGTDPSQIAALIRNFPLSFLTNLWFLWAVFWSYLLVLLAECLSRRTADGRKQILRKTILYLLIFAWMFVTPDGLNLGVYKYMFPYFLIGYGIGCRRFRTVSGNTDAGNACKEHSPLYSVLPRTGAGSYFFLLFLSGAAFLLLLSAFHADTLIYLSGYKLIGQTGAEETLAQLGRDLLRFGAGLSGCAFFALLFRRPVQRYSGAVWIRTLASLGRDSLGIYILSGYLLNLVLLPVSDRLISSMKGMDGAMNLSLYLINLLEAVCVLAASWGLTEIFRRNSVLKILIGE